MPNCRVSFQACSAVLDNEVAGIRLAAEMRTEDSAHTPHRRRSRRRRHLNHLAGSIRPALRTLIRWRWTDAMPRPSIPHDVAAALRTDTYARQHNLPPASHVSMTFDRLANGLPSIQISTTQFKRHALNTHSRQSPRDSRSKTMRGRNTEKSV